MVLKGLKMTIKANLVTVMSKNSTLTRDFKLLPILLWLANNCTDVRAHMFIAKSKQLSKLRSMCSYILNLFEGVRARVYFAKYKLLSLLRFMCSHIQKLFVGVDKKFEYKMRFVYAHLLINAFIIYSGCTDFSLCL